MSNTTYIGTSKLKKCFVGNTKVRKIYVGNSKVYSGTPEFYVGDTFYNPTDEQIASGFEVAITTDKTIRFESFDNTSFKLTVCVIGGGGGGGTSYYDVGPAFGTVAGGGGGEGGQVQSTSVVPSEGSTFSVTIGAGSTGTGGTTTGFGLTSVGGNGGGNHWFNGTGEPCYGDGGSGRAGADGGRGGTLSASPYIWIENRGAPGANGTAFHSKYYGGGGGGFGATSGADGAGQANYGGGAHGSSNGNRTSGKNGAVILLIENK